MKHRTSIVAFAAMAAMGAAVPALAAEFTIVHTFSMATGRDPQAPIEDGRGLVFGLTGNGGAGGAGVLYQFDGANYSVLHEFDFVDGVGSPYALTSDGATLYGLQGNGESARIWAWSPAGGFRIVAVIEGQQVDHLVAAGDGRLYLDRLVFPVRYPHGASESLRVDPANGKSTSLRIVSRGGSHAVLARPVAAGSHVAGTTFTGPWVFDTARGRYRAIKPTRGDYFPGVGIVQQSLYGTLDDAGSGAFYRVDAVTGFQVVAPFIQQAADPKGNLATGTDGALYGIFHGAGAGTCVGTPSAGFVHRFDPATLLQTPLHDFCGTDISPQGLAAHPDGSLYGTVFTLQGGYLYRLVP